MQIEYIEPPMMLCFFYDLYIYSIAESSTQ